MIQPLHTLSAVELVGLISNGDATVRQVADAHLDRIAERDPAVRAFAHLDPDAVRASADRMDRDGAGFPLNGVPIAVKDLIDTDDLPTEYGSAIHKGHRPDRDADVVAATRSAGGLVLGKTVTTEFAWRHAGPTKNPMSLDRPEPHTPGGSSSGSAAAVADFMAPLAFGTQTAGSVIRPAAFCGVVGFKPTFSTYPRHGVKPLSGYLDTVGTMARSVVDISLLDSALKGQTPDRLDVFDVGGPRIGVFVPFADQADRDTVSVIDYVRKLAESKGALIIDIAGWSEFDQMEPVHNTIMMAEAARELKTEFDTAYDQLIPFYQQALAEGREIPDDAYYGAMATADGFRNDAAAQLDGVDIILTPASAGAAPAGLESTGDPVFNKIWTLLRWPCVTIPVGRNADGLPVGVQIVAGYGRDSAALAAAHWLERLIGAVAEQAQS